MLFSKVNKTLYGYLIHLHIRMNTAIKESKEFHCETLIINIYIFNIITCTLISFIYPILFNRFFSLSSMVILVNICICNIKYPFYKDNSFTLKKILRKKKWMIVLC